MTEHDVSRQSAQVAFLLRQVSWFSGCKPASIQALLERGRVRQLARGEALSRRGEPVAQLCLLLKGVLEMSLSTAAGKRHVESYLNPGQLTNLIPFLDGHGAIHDAVAHAEAWVMMIDRALFDELLAAEPELMHRVLRLLCLRSRLSYANVAGASLLTLNQRCARALLQLSKAYGRPTGEGVAIALKLSQEALADMVGCSRPVLNRELKLLEREGFITMRYSHYVISDPARLRTLVRDIAPARAGAGG